MWQEAIDSMKGFFKSQSVSDDEKEELADTMQRLRQRSRKLAASNASEVDNARKVSLFGSVNMPQSSERRSVGHWCESSAAAAREEHTIMVQHSYESDFGAGAPLAENNLYPFLARSAQHKALHGYIMNNDLHRPTNDVATESSEKNVVEMPSVIAMNALTDTEELLLRAAQDGSDEFVRASVAANENAPTAAMWLLAADKSPTVKLALIENPSVPLAVLEVLGKDFDSKIARRAQTKVRKIGQNEAGIAFGNLSREYDSSEEIDNNSADIYRAV